MKTRFLPLFVVVAALALLAGFLQSGGAVPQSEYLMPHRRQPVGRMTMVTLGTIQ
jgi:hypothetical protein